MEAVGNVVVDADLVLDLGWEDGLATPVAGVALAEAAPHLLRTDAQEGARVEPVTDTLSDGDLARHREFSPVRHGTSPLTRVSTPAGTSTLKAEVRR